VLPNQKFCICDKIYKHFPLQPNFDSIFIISQIDQASLGLSREYLIQGRAHPFVQAYQNYQIDLAVLMGAPRERAITEMNAVLDFEFRLAEVRD
jgi:hypothetical protein